MSKMLNRIKGFLSAIYLKRAIIFELAKRDFQQQYMGSYLGFVWVFLQPLLFILVLYSVFTFGFRRGGDRHPLFRISCFRHDCLDVFFESFHCDDRCCPWA